MAWRTQKLFGEEERAAIERAIAGAEARTSGELVVSVVEASDEYAHAVWKGAALGGFAGILFATGATFLWPDLWWPLWIWSLAPGSAGAAAGLFLADRFPGARRWLATPEVMVRHVGQRATAAFVRAELFKTRDRTGILIFLSLFEHRVVVLADAGISRTVAQSDWDAISAGIADGMKRRQPVPALIAAIDRCGALLDEHRLHPKINDADELPNRVRTED